MNHPEAWCVGTIQIGCQTYTQDDAITIMRNNASQDKTYSLASQLLAAKLNVLCKGSDASCVSGAIGASDAWLCEHPVGSNVRASSSAWQEIKATYNSVVKYNDGKLCAPICR
jgi:hypothetical protein